MGQVMFGKKGYNAPTPSGLSTAIDVFTGVCGVIITWLTTVAFIPSNISNVIASILGLLIMISQVIKPLFGVNTTQTNVPITQVGEMATPDSGK